MRAEGLALCPAGAIVATAPEMATVVEIETG
jgi:hypothetical protein